MIHPTIIGIMEVLLGFSLVFPTVIRMVCITHLAISIVRKGPKKLVDYADVAFFAYSSIYEGKD